MASAPSLIEATKNSTAAWQADLQSLFKHAKDRFPDVVWDLVNDESDNDAEPEEVWGHKAIVYARAPPSFQARYFSFRPAPIASPLPFSASPVGTLPAQSALSLSIGPEFPPVSRSPSPYHQPSLAPSINAGPLLRLATSISPALFSNELEYLYTGKGFGEAFEFLFDTSESREQGDAEENRIDKLRKDLVFMWRSRLYSDVRIALTGTFSSSNHENTMAIFSSHRFILVSRSPYFQAQMLSWTPPSKQDDEPLTVTLPSPPFTPASLHFTLGYIYTGTLIFSHRTYDLDTAFHILRSATYLSLDCLYNEVQARIVQEMMHGLFHAFLEFAEYERMTGGRWGSGGCRCRQCARRAPRVLEFALSDDVKNSILERGARRALVGLFGEGWCTSEFASLPQKLRDSLLKGLGKRTTPANVFPLLFAAQHAMAKLKPVIDAWADISKEMVLAAQKNIDEVLCARAEEAFEQPDWLELMEADGTRFEDGDKVGSVMDAIRRGLNEKNAGSLYQTLVSSILLRPHATESDATMLSATSHVRIQVEETRMDILRWMRKRWMGIRQEGGFDNLESWALTEISGEIDVPVDDLMSPTISPPKGPLGKTGMRPSLVREDDETDTTSMHSFRGSTLERTKQGSLSPNDPPKSSASSVRSSARSTHSVASKIASPAAVRRSQITPTGPRPDSKLTPSSLGFSSRSSLISTDSQQSFGTRSRVVSPTARRSTATKSTVSLIQSPSGRPKSLASSVTSVRSHASTIRNGSSAAGPSIVRPPKESRPVSDLSTGANSSITFRTANSDLHPSSASVRSRKASGASTISNVSVRTTGPTPSNAHKTGRPSGASTTSTISNISRSTKTANPQDTQKLSTPSAVRRPQSAVSIRSTITTSSVASSSRLPLRGKNGLDETSPSVPVNRIGRSSDDAVKDNKITKITATAHVSSPSSGSASTVKTLKRSSVDTVRKSVTTISSPVQDSGVALKDDMVPKGATLDVGIPCIISSKRKRFRAYARYIGEVEGETGPWVGVEVPVGDDWPGDKLEGRDWHDGSWGGIRYFEMSGSCSEWEYGDERATRRRRVDHGGGFSRDQGLKRDGDYLPTERAKRIRSASPTASDVSTLESRGLFVRPQQVLYVVDAVGSDF